MRSRSRSGWMRPESISVRSWLGACGALLLMVPTNAGAVTIGVGQIVELTTSTNFPAGDPLDMDGGRLRFFDPGIAVPIQISATNAILRRGIVENTYAQGFASSVTFDGLTTIPGGPVGPIPADRMYLSASPFDTAGIDAINNGTFVQSGNGELTLIGRVRFTAAIFST